MRRDEANAMATIAPRVRLMLVEEGARVYLQSDYGETGGSVEVPYLRGRRHPDGSIGLTLDDRLGLDLPAEMGAAAQEAAIEFIANAIAVGAGYASIYYTDRKMPFRG